MELAFRYPVAKDFQASDLYAFRVSLRLKQEGVLTKRQLEDALIEKGLVEPDIRQKIEELRKQISLIHPKHTLTLQLEESDLVELVLLEILGGVRLYTFRERDYWNEDVSYPQPFLDLKVLLDQFEPYMKYSLEYQLKELRMRDLLVRCVYAYDENRQIWKTKDLFGQEVNLMGLNRLTEHFYRFLNGFSSKVIRLVARSPQWSLRWMAATETGSPLFPGPITDWNVNQVSLCYWSMFYGNLSEDPDAPRGEKVNNDELVDAYVRQRSDKFQRERGGQVPISNIHQKHQGVPEVAHKIQFKGK